MTGPLLPEPRHFWQRWWQQVAQRRWPQPGWWFVITVLALVVIGVSSWWLLTRSSFGRRTVFWGLLPSRPPLTDTTRGQYLVYGFWPYWNVAKATLQPELTHLAYFAFPVTADGELDGLSVPATQDPDARNSIRRWKSSLIDEKISKLNNEQKLVITITQFDRTTIHTFLSSPSAQSRFQLRLQEFLDSSQRPIAGINIDIEYAGEATPQLRQDYVQLVRATRQTLDDWAVTRQRPALELSASVFASAASRPLLWDLPVLAPYLDRVVMMAYDFHRPSSPVAGPVAPVFGAKESWDHDVVLHLREFLTQLPAEKILLGVPFYGYEWETTTAAPRSLAYPGTGSVASYSRVQRLLTQPQPFSITTGWDSEALAPYLTYQKDGRQFVIYYEDARSLRYKLELVTGLRLGGIAIWALGYEEDDRQLWDTISRQLK